jgi:hypothetical protein
MLLKGKKKAKLLSKRAKRAYRDFFFKKFLVKN